MGFDNKIMNLSRIIYQTSIMSHGSNNNPNEQIEKIRGLVREFIRDEVVPYELTDGEKTSFIIKNEIKITEAIFKGHKATDQDEFAEIRKKIKQYRKDLKLI